MERRKSRRWRSHLDVRFWRLGSREVHYGFTSDISTTGIFISTPIVLPSGTRIRLEVRDGRRSFVAEGMVARSTKTAPELQRLRVSGMGVRFLGVEELVTDLVPAVVDAQSEAVEPATPAQEGGDTLAAVQGEAVEPTAPAQQDGATMTAPQAAGEASEAPARAAGATLGAAIDRFVAEELPGAGAAKARKVKSQLAWWQEDLGSLPLAHLTDERLEEAERRLVAGVSYGSKKRSRKTVASFKTALREVLTAASRDWGWLARNPLAEEPPRQKPRPTAAKPKTRPPAEGVFRLRFDTREQLREVYARDVETGGLFVPTEHPAPMHADVWVEIAVGGAETAPVRLAARVVHVTRHPASVFGKRLNLLAGMGVEFRDHEAARKALRTLAGLG